MLSKIRNSLGVCILIHMTSLFLIVFPSCGGKNAKGDTVAIAPVPSPSQSADYHADNDIAMIVRSIADALTVGEPLDSAEYDFEGILTDGQGAPLYTDVQGGPGIWVVDVLDTKSATLRNLYLGDLLPNDLETYLLQTLHLTDEDRMEFKAHDAVDDEETNINVYDFDGGYMRFEIRSGIAPNGLEGPLLTIIMSADLPTGAETQTKP